MVKKTCLICGKEFEVRPSRAKTAKYCSNECQHESLKGKPNCTCEVCGKMFHRKQYRINKTKHLTCSRTCAYELRKVLYAGENNHQWGLKGPLNASYKGAEIQKRNNHLVDIHVYVPNHPNADKRGRVTKHRLLVEQHYERFDAKYFEEIDGQFYLKKSTQVHHINFNHDDNRIDNLMPVTKSEHRVIHMMHLEIIRDISTGRITGVIKRGELLGSPEVGNQQPSKNGDVFEGSETNSRVLRDGNADTSAPPQK